MSLQYCRGGALCGHLGGWLAGWLAGEVEYVSDCRRKIREGKTILEEEERNENSKIKVRPCVPNYAAFSFLYQGDFTAVQDHIISTCLLLHSARTHVRVPLIDDHVVILANCRHVSMDSFTFIRSCGTFSLYV